MTHLSFEKTKRELFALYENEITSLVEGKVAEEQALEDQLPPSDREMREQIPEHLRISYPRQQLLCLRASKVTPCLVPCYREKPPGEGEEEEEEVAPPKLSDEDIAKYEAILLEQEIEDHIRARGLLDVSPAKRQMLRVQAESVKRLKQSVLEQMEYKEKKRASEAAAAPSPTEEDAALDECALARQQVAEHNAEVVRAGGVSRDKYDEQRLELLDEMEMQLRREQLDRVAHNIA